jgi:hypothetical protein
MKKHIDTAKTVVDLIGVAVNAGIAIADARRRAREEEQKKSDDAKDRRIKELERQLAEKGKSP